MKVVELFHPRHLPRRPLTSLNTYHDGSHQNTSQVNRHRRFRTAILHQHPRPELPSDHLDTDKAHRLLPAHPRRIRSPTIRVQDPGDKLSVQRVPGKVSWNRQLDCVVADRLTCPLRHTALAVLSDSSCYWPV